MCDQRIIDIAYIDETKRENYCNSLDSRVSFTLSFFCGEIIVLKLKNKM